MAHSFDGKTHKDGKTQGRSGGVGWDVGTGRCRTGFITEMEIAFVIIGVVAQGTGEWNKIRGRQTRNHRQPEIESHK